MSLLHLPFGEDVMFAGPATSAAVLKVIGEVSLVLGRVTVSRLDENGEKIEVALKRGDELYEGDEINTGGRSFIKAKMLDGTKFHLGKNARATLNEFEYDESAKVGKFEATVFTGGFHYKSGKIGKMFADGSRKHAQISTPQAIIGIRGSEADGVVASDGTFILKHISGVFSISDVNGNPIGELDNPTDAVVVFADGTGTVTPLAELSPQLADALDQYNQEQVAADAVEREVEDEEAQEEETQEQEEAEAGDQAPDQEVEEQAAEEAEAEETEGEEEEEEGEEGEEGEEEEGEEEEEENTDEETTDEETVDEEGAEEQAPDEKPAGEETAEEETAEEGQSEEEETREEAAEEESTEETQEEAAQEERAASDESTGGDGSTRADEPGEPAGTEASENGDSGDASGDGSSSESGTPDTFDSGSDDGVLEESRSFGQDQGVDVTGDQAGDILGESQGDDVTGSDGGDDGDSTEDRFETLDVPDTDASEDETTERDEETEAPKEEELPPDNPPVAGNDSIRISEPGQVDLTQQVLANDFDGDEGQTVRLGSVATPSRGGSAQFDGTTLLYEPSGATLDSLKGGETATETFNYTVRSGDLTDTGVVTVTLVGTNVAPLASNDTGETIEDSPITL
ncbi:MAG: hypothetical protein HOE54_00945, partial [Gammaproteobacteria bacterium]|nr:hypothetical protein [Gammaproteobacteria bacterium]